MISNVLVCGVICNDLFDVFSRVLFSVMMSIVVFIVMISSALFSVMCIFKLHTVLKLMSEIVPYCPPQSEVI